MPHLHVNAVTNVSHHASSSMHRTSQSSETERFQQMSLTSHGKGNQCLSVCLSVCPSVVSCGRIRCACRAVCAILSVRVGAQEKDTNWLSDGRTDRQTDRSIPAVSESNQHKLSQLSQPSVERNVGASAPHVVRLTSLIHPSRYCCASVRVVSMEDTPVVCA